MLSLSLSLTKNKTNAEDLVSITVLSAIESIRRNPVYLDNPEAYITKIMKYKFFSHFCGKKEEEYFDNTSVSPDQEAIIYSKSVHDLIQKYNDRDREIVTRFIGGMNCTSISRRMRGFRSSAGAVKKTIDTFTNQVMEIV